MFAMLDKGKIIGRAMDGLEWGSASPMQALFKEIEEACVALELGTS